MPTDPWASVRTAHDFAVRLIHADAVKLRDPEAVIERLPPGRFRGRPDVRRPVDAAIVAEIDRAIGRSVIVRVRNDDMMIRVRAGARMRWIVVPLADLREAVPAVRAPVDIQPGHDE